MYSIVNTYMELVNIPVLDMEGRPTGKTYLDLFLQKDHRETEPRCNICQLVWQVVKQREIFFLP